MRLSDEVISNYPWCKPFENGCTLPKSRIGGTSQFMCVESVRTGRPTSGSESKSSTRR